MRPEHSALLVQRAESLGFDAVWFGDHIVNPVGSESRYPYSASGSAGYSIDTPLSDVWVSIAHAAALTDSIELGPSVLILPLRHPAAVAQAAVTAQNASGGRLRLGLGAGWLREEFEALGVPFETRGRRMDEALEIIRWLWTGEEVEFDGEFFQVPPVKLGMTPAVPIPITIGGASPAALRRAATSDGWNAPEISLDDAVRMRERLSRLREGVGKGEGPFRMYVKPASVATEVLLQFREAGFEDVVVPFRALYAGVGPMSLEQHLAALEQLAERIMIPELV
ncbi:MAG TPA: TIGR03619 family F420-dependent LLM class oxidoreductase [Solirubrobacteraceae bacterium]|nr:TIGR03619 family F420-dependent LLM class oxidoreductase [Solirubrobacteraceae bacterium]